MSDVTTPRVQVRIEVKINPRKPNFVRAEMESIGDGGKACWCGATLDYCLDKAKHFDYEIVNAQEVLMWLNRNSTFVPHGSNLLK